jgi:hypothetical protein
VDKASAEKGVQVIETRVLAALRNRVFFTLDERQSGSCSPRSTRGR